jgi:F0F1-type ATP synthase membrane subunit c/vacuolar-type H+-ATPase subunit K
MSLLDGKLDRPSLLDYLTLKGLLIGCALTFGASSIGLILLSITTFTARDEQGTIMTFILVLFAMCALSGFFLIIFAIVALLQRNGNHKAS